MTRGKTGSRSERVLSRVGGSRPVPPTATYVARVLECAVGAALGPNPEHGPGRGKTSLASDVLSPQDRYRCRLLYQRTAVATLTADGKSGRQIARVLECAVGAALGEAEVGSNQFKGSLASEASHLTPDDRSRCRLLYQHRAATADLRRAVCDEDRPIAWPTAEDRARAQQDLRRRAAGLTFDDNPSPASHA